MTDLLLNSIRKSKKDEREKRMLKAIKGKNVKMLPGLFQSRMKLNEDYLMELDPGCLLQNFYIEAGIIPPCGQVINDPEKAKMHWGWEAPNCQLRGHFLGHWLSAAANLCAAGDKPELLAKVDYIVAELARCQEMNGGEWVGSIPEKYFAMLIPGRYIWSPQYTMHKTIMGLKDVYEKLGNKTAIEILNKLADWYVRWVKEMRESNPDAVYSGEQAGMLEVWADLYELTKQEKYLFLVKAYENNMLFDRLDQGGDALSDDHANASIPLAHGAARLAEITGDNCWAKRLENFWKTAVEERGMFATTGCNAGEFWIPPHMQGRYLGNEDQEFCTVYNMVRTAEYLFRRTGDKKYADYIERALYNGFLAQQNKDTGMPTYFLPLLPGSRKKWGSRTRDFWCCFGTMIQAQTLYPDLIWYISEDSVNVSQYIPSEAEISLKAGKVKVSQRIHMKDYNNQVLFDEHSGGRVSRWSIKFNILSEVKGTWTLRLRIPGWCIGEPGLSLNGKPAQAQKHDGYLVISRQWEGQSELDVFFPSNVMFERLEGAEELVCAVDGPIVLAGLTDRDTGLQGNLSDPDSILLPEQSHTYGTFVWTQNTYMTRHQKENFRLVPLYEVTDEKYTVYFSAEN